MTDTIVVHAKSSTADLETGLVVVSGIDLGDLISEIGAREILDNIDLSLILDHVADKLREAKEDEE